MTVGAVRTALRAAIAVLAVSYAMGAVSLGFDADEWQMVAAGEAVARGEKLYSEVWDNHGPGITWALAAWFRVAPPEDHSFMLAMRVATLLLLFATTALAYGWARGFRCDCGECDLATDGLRRPASLLPEVATLLVLTSYVWARKGFEIRGDNPMNFLWVLSLALWFRAFRSGRALEWALAGVVLGGCFLFSFKTTILGLGAGAMFLAAMALRRKLMLREMAVFGAGTAVAPAVMLAILASQGIAGDFWASYVGQNTDRGYDLTSEGIKTLFEADARWTVALLAGIAYAGFRAWRREAPEVVAILTPCALWMLLQFCLLLPTFFLQSFLSAIVPGAIVVAWSALDLATRRGAPLAAAVAARVPALSPARLAIVGVALWTGLAIEETDYYRPRSRARDLVAEADRLLELVPAGEFVFDGYGVPVLRPRPTTVKSFVATLRDRIGDGQFDLDLVGALEEKDVRFVVYDKRVADLTAELRDFLSANYLPLREPDVLAAGFVLARGGEAASDGSVPFTVRVAGEYRWAVAASEDGSDWLDAPELWIDGRPAPNPVRLDDGARTARWTGEGPLVLCIRPPEEWGEWRVAAPGPDRRALPRKKLLDEERGFFWPEAAETDEQEDGN